MNEYQKQVVAEKGELDERARKLSDFIGLSDQFVRLAPEEQERMKVQNDLMWQLSETLGARIAAFKTDTPKVPDASPLTGVVDRFEEIREANPYLRFELAWAKATGWMVWVMDYSGGSRKFVVSAQSEDYREACAEALEAISPSTMEGDSVCNRPNGS